MAQVGQSRSGTRYRLFDHWWFVETRSTGIKRQRGIVENPAGTLWRGSWRLRERRARRDGQQVATAFVDRDPFNPLRERSL